MTESVPVLPPSRAIPVSVAQSFVSWWTVGAKEGAASEERLLRKLPFFLAKGVPTPSPVPSLIARTLLVPLSKPSHYINTLSMVPTAAEKTSSGVVLLHGYGAGLGFFFRNLGPLGAWAERRGTPVYALDWLGMGRSARVPFRVRAGRLDVAGRVAEAEGFFVESLEDWRKRMGLEKMTLVGHSLGAYMSVVYALRHPERVEQLVLLSPAGVTRAPERIAAEKESRMRRVAMHLWEEGWSPFQVVRSLGFFGPLLVGKYSARRFSGLTEEETRDMHDYILNITLAKGSSEYCISHILAPGAYARMPLVDRIGGLKMPVTFIYGDHDWMEPKGGECAIAELGRNGNTHTELHLVPEAGHHLYMDNSHATNRLLIRALDRRCP